MQVYFRGSDVFPHRWFHACVYAENQSNLFLFSMLDVIRSEGHSKYAGVDGIHADFFGTAISYRD